MRRPEARRRGPRSGPRHPGKPPLEPPSGRAAQAVRPLALSGGGYRGCYGHHHEPAFRFPRRPSARARRPASSEASVSSRPRPAPSEETCRDPEGRQEAQAARDAASSCATPASWSRRARAASPSGSVLMSINRLCGLVLPGTTKFLLDEVIGKGNREMLGQLVLAAGAATLIQAVTSLRPLPGPGQGRAALDHRDAPRSPAARRPPAGALLRADQVGRPAVARHERRRGASATWWATAWSRSWAASSRPSWRSASCST